MTFTSDLLVPVAAVNIDLASSTLASLLNGERPGKNARKDEKINWAHLVCTYTRLLHLRTWLDLEPVTRVRREFLPQLQAAESSLEALLQQEQQIRLSTAEVHKLSQYWRNTTARRINLERNYCEGLDSAFEPSATEPPHPT